MAVAIVHSEYPDTDWRVEVTHDVEPRARYATAKVRLVCGSVGLPPMTPSEARALADGLAAAIALADPDTSGEDE